MERTVRKIAVPGKIAQWGAKSRLSLASKSSRPQVGMSGGKPRPRNESVDSAMIAAATSSEPATMTGAIALGRMCRTTDRKSTRLNSSHQIISYAVFCLKKKKKNQIKLPDG